MNSRNENEPKIAQIGAYVTLPFVLAVPPLLGALFGRWLDSWIDISPWGLYLFLALGFLAGIREFVRILKRFQDND